MGARCDHAVRRASSSVFPVPLPARTAGISRQRGVRDRRSPRALRRPSASQWLRSLSESAARGQPSPHSCHDRAAWTGACERAVAVRHRSPRRSSNRSWSRTGRRRDAGWLRADVGARALDGLAFHLLSLSVDMVRRTHMEWQFLVGAGSWLEHGLCHDRPDGRLGAAALFAALPAVAPTKTITERSAIRSKRFGRASEASQA